MQTIDDTRHERLLQLIEEHRTQAALAKVIGKSPAQISQWVNRSPNSKTGKPRVMDSATARDIERACGKPQGWMDSPPDAPRSPAIEGERPPSVNHVTQDFANTAFNTHRAPIVSWGLMGEDAVFRENLSAGELVAPVDFGEGAVVWRIEDDSMSPDYNPGDFIALDDRPATVSGISAGEAAIFETSTGTKILRYYTPLVDGHFEARPPHGSRYAALSTLQLTLRIKAVVQAHLRVRRSPALRMA